MDRMMANKFDFNDFLKQWQAMNNMGGTQMMKLLPGFNKISEKQLYEAEKKFKMYEMMIKSMEEEVGAVLPGKGRFHRLLSGGQLMLVVTPYAGASRPGPALQVCRPTPARGPGFGLL